MLFRHKDISHFSEGFAFSGGVVQFPTMLLSCGLNQAAPAPKYLCDGLVQGIMTFAVWQYTLTGEGTLDYEDAPSLSLLPGSLMLLTTPHKYRYYRAQTAEKWEFLFVCMTGEVTIQLCRQLIARHGPVNRLPTPSSALVVAEEILAAACDRRIASDWMASRLAYDLLMSTGKDLESDPLGKGTPDFIRRVKEYCALHSDRPMQVGELAKIAGYSHFHFVRLFKAHVGIAPSEYLREVRLFKARHLLQVTRASVKEAAASSGFVSTSHFSRAFRQRFGVAPGEIRQAGRSGVK